jgi:PepSY-associated TM region
LTRAQTRSIAAIAWKWLIVGHRWLGIATCLLFVAWFASGLVMLYVPFPGYSPAERLSRLEPIDWERVQIAPERVLHGRALAEFPSDFRLEMLFGEPVYRVRASSSAHTVSAATGKVIETVDADQARAIAARATKRSVTSLDTIERDQWTVAGTYHGHRPLHRVAVDDERGLELYVSSRTGEIVLETTARERGWNWPGAVLHWLYFTELRANPPLWSQVVMWTSGIGIVVAITGLWLGIDRLRIRPRNGSTSITPFRGWMAWHHVAGILGGTFVLTFIFSGWLSMDPPVPWGSEFDPRRPATVAAALAGNSEPKFPADVATLQRLDAQDAREASFMWALGMPQIVLTDGAARRRVIDTASGAPRRLSEDALIALAGKSLPDAQLASVERLEREDAYWYSRRVPRVLPVLRFKFADADRTWLHVDPETGRPVGWLRDSDRIHRWLFNALHSFDFRWLLSNRPAWDAVMWLLSLAGLTLCVTSVVIGWRALRR